MDENQLLEMLEEIRNGSMNPNDAVRVLRRLPFADIGQAKIDHHRQLRTGQPEAIYGPGKTTNQCVSIVRELLENGSGPIILSRPTPDQIEAVTLAHKGALVEASSVIWRPAEYRHEKIVIASAGTADLPVAEESAAILRAYGIQPIHVSDIGVAGLHRFLAELDHLIDADIVITIAGMEGALATAVGGVTAAPVIAVPTSVGYGASLNGVTALLAMHAACAAGITVVGIDNGFGAAMATIRILDMGRNK